jgi:hypothetical protein
MSEGNVVAPEGCVWVCSACGKLSRDRYGSQAISHGWDAACVLSCVLVKKTHLVCDASGRVTSVKEGGLVEQT